jgi:hypothetical protein
MKKLSIILICSLAIISTNVNAQRKVVMQELSTNCEKFKMKGLGLWQFNKKVSFSNFTVSNIKRSATVSSTTSFKNDNNGFVKSKHKSKMSFDVSNGVSTANITSKFILTDLEISTLKNKLNIPLDYSKSFFGAIQIEDNTWDYAVETESDVIDGIKNAGMAKDKNGNEINIIPMNGAGANVLAKLSNISYAFTINNKIVGGTNARGEVWLDKDLDANTKLAVSSLATIITFQYLNNVGN